MTASFINDNNGYTQAAQEWTRSVQWLAIGRDANYYDMSVVSTISLGKLRATILMYKNSTRYGFDV